MELRDVIRAKIEEHSNRCYLNQDTVDFMVEALAVEIYFLIEKFIKGQKEHGGSLLDRDCLKEISLENRDIFWYLAAHKQKQNMTQNEHH